jgi:hypothetical protein
MKSLIVLTVMSVLSWDISVAQTVISHPTSVYKCVHHDTSPPLRDMMLIGPGSGPEEWEEGEVPNPSLLLKTFEDENAAGQNREADPVLQNEPGDLPPNSTILNFDGVSNVNMVLPPDPNGDVGPNHYIQTVNLAFAIYSKAGALLYGPANLRTLWEGFVGYAGDGDPIVLYDHLADRWMISQFAFPNYPYGPGYELIAISQTPDPLGAWHRYSYQFTDMPDYPKFAVWPDGYYLSVNSYEFNTGVLKGSAAGVFERDSMLAGKNARFIFFQQNPATKPMLPSDLDGPAPSSGIPANFLLVKEAPAGSGGDQINIFQLHTDWTNVANSTFTGPQVLSTEPFDPNMCSGDRNCIPQMGTSAKLDALAGFLMHRVQYRNFGSHQVMVASQTVDADGTDHAAIRWYELRDYGSGWSIYQQGTYAPDANHRWMGSIAMDGQHNIALGYSVSGTSIYPSIRATGRRSTDPPGIMTFLEEPIVNGGGYQSSGESRWGDYSMLALDPADDETFWYTNEYYLSSSYMNWRTRIATFKISTLPVGTGNESYAENGLVVKNSPNPFIHSTSIEYHLPSACHVTVKVYDLLGHELAELVNAVEEAGNRSVTFCPEDLRPGIYFYIIRAGDAVATGKMIKSY